MVLFESVSVRYGSGPRILTDVNFLLAPGSFHFLIGPSGAGKSSLLRLMYLAMRPSAGAVTLFGRDIGHINRNDLAHLRRRIGIVFQDFRLIDHLSVFDNVALPLRIAGMRESNIRRHVAELLRWVGLAEHMQALPETLSGGEQQRVAIARAVITRPSLLLADEPTGNIDAKIGIRLMYLFEELNRMGTTVVVATHNETWVEKLPHRQLRIDGNHLRVQEQGRAK